MLYSSKQIAIHLVTLTFSLAFSLLGNAASDVDVSCEKSFQTVRSVYQLDAQGSPVGVSRLETLGGRTVKVLDVTGTVAEKQAKSDPGLNIIDISDVFGSQVSFLGFGKPNVYLGTYSPTGASVKFAAKSLKRGDSEVVETRGRVQSGVLIAFKNLKPAQQLKLFEAAQKHEGTRRWTCVNANCRVLEDAGFSLASGKHLSSYYFPTPLLQDILKYGMLIDREPVEIDIVRTTPKFLEDAGLSIDQAVVATPVRHTSRALAPLLNRLNANTWVVRIKSKMSEVLSLFISEGEPRVLEAERVRMAPRDDFETYNVEISEPSKFGTLLTLLFGPHAIFKVPLPSQAVDSQLPTPLKEFPQAKPTLLTRIKKSILFSRPVVAALRSQIASRSREFQGLTEKDLYDMLRTDTDDVPNKYNIVITGDAITLMKIGIRVGWFDWVLSKHVLVSGYSKDVRFAGEVWKSRDGKIHFNGNSGTYMPTAAQVEAAGLLLKSIFPHAEIEEHLH